MTDASFPLPSPLTATAVVAALAWSSTALPNWFGLIRTVMMVLGGIVAVIIVLVVAIAVISGVMGMMGRLRKRHD